MGRLHAPAIRVVGAGKSKLLPLTSMAPPTHTCFLLPAGLGAGTGTDDPYLLMPRAYNPLLGNVPLFPAFPLYSVTPISGNISLSAIGTSSTFPATHLIMSSPLVNLTVDIAQAFQVHREGQ